MSRYSKESLLYTDSVQIGQSLEIVVFILCILLGDILLG